MLLDWSWTFSEAIPLNVNRPSRKETGLIPFKNDEQGAMSNPVRHVIPSCFAQAWRMHLPISIVETGFGDAGDIETPMPITFIQVATVVERRQPSQKDIFTQDAQACSQCVEEFCPVWCSDICLGWESGNPEIKLACVSLCNLQGSCGRRSYLLNRCWIPSSLDISLAASKWY